MRQQFPSVEFPPHNDFRSVGRKSLLSGIDVQLLRAFKGRKLFVRAAHVAALHNVGVLSLGYCQQTANVVGVQKVVTVEKGQVFASGYLHSRVASGRYASVCFVNYVDARVLPCILVGNCSAAVGRAVVHQNEFPVGIGLAQDALNAVGQVLLHLVAGNDDGDSIFYPPLALMAARDARSGQRVKP